jgi:hypothetical protein
MAAPSVALKLAYLSDSLGILMNVTHNREKIFVSIHQYCLVPTPEQCAISSMAAIEALRVNPIQMAHDPGEISLRGLKEKMVVVGHETVRVGVNLPQVDNLTQEL